MKVVDLYNTYKDNYKEYVVFIKIGNFYETYNNDAYIISKIMNYKVKNISNNVRVGFPITSLVKFEETSTIKSMKSMNFNANQVLNILDNDFSFLVEYTKDLIKVFNDKNDYYTSNILNNILMYLEKELWMIKSSLK